MTDVCFEDANVGFDLVHVEKLLVLLFVHLKFKINTFLEVTDKDIVSKLFGN